MVLTVHQTAGIKEAARPFIQSPGVVLSGWGRCTAFNQCFKDDMQNLLVVKVKLLVICL